MRIESKKNKKKYTTLLVVYNKIIDSNADDLLLKLNQNIYTTKTAIDIKKSLSNLLSN